MHPLFEAGTLRGDDDFGPSAFTIEGGDETLRIDGGDVDVQKLVEYPAGLAIDHVDRPNHQHGNPFSNGPITKGLPSQIQEMKADDQQDKKPYVDRAPVFGVLAICLDAIETHDRNLEAKIRNY